MRKVEKRNGAGHLHFRDEVFLNISRKFTDLELEKDFCKRLPK